MNYFREMSRYDVSPAIQKVEDLNFRKSPSKRRKIAKQFRAACGGNVGNTHFKARAQHRRNNRVSHIGAKQQAKIDKVALAAV